MDEEPAGAAAHEPRPRTVVGVDGSIGCRAALAHAWVAAARRGADLDVVSVEPSLQEWGYPLLDSPSDAVRQERVVARARAVVDEVAQEPVVAGTAGTAAVPVRVRALSGPVPRTLVDAASDADLLVVGSRGHGALRGLLLGSVALCCVVHGRCPVLVVRPSPRAADAVPGDADRLAARS